MKKEIDLELLSRREAGEYLRICLNTLDKLAIPRVKIRHRVLYRKSEVEKWVIQNSKIKGA